MPVTRQIATRRGLRLMQHGVLVGEVPVRPGPAHGLYDVLAAAMRVLATGPETALLGFAAGGVLAPFRAMGCRGRVHGVDLDRASYDLFMRHVALWAGPVRWSQAEAGVWLRGRTRLFHLIVEDLSLPAEGDVVKPEGTWSVLPRLIRARLRPGGAAVFNLLKPFGQTWNSALARIAGSFPHHLVVRFRDYENRLLLASDRPLQAGRVSRAMRHSLRCIGSRMARSFQVRRAG